MSHAMPRASAAAHVLVAAITAATVAATFVTTLVARPGAARAGTVTGKLALPASGPPPLRDAGFLDRVENPHMPVKPVDPTPFMVVVLVPTGTPPDAGAPAQASWDLLGASFARPIIPVVAGAEVMIRNCKACRPASLYVDGAPDLIQKGVLNPTGTKLVKTTKPGVLVVKDEELTSLVGRIVAFASPYFALPDAAGKFEIKDVPAGSYKLRVWYVDHFIERGDEDVALEGKKTVDVPNVSIPTGFPGAASK